MSLGGLGARGGAPRYYSSEAWGWGGCFDIVPVRSVDEGARSGIILLSPGGLGARRVFRYPSWARGALWLRLLALFLQLVVFLGSDACGQCYFAGSCAVAAATAECGRSHGARDNVGTQLDARPQPRTWKITRAHGHRNGTRDNVGTQLDARPQPREMNITSSETRPQPRGANENTRSRDATSEVVDLPALLLCPETQHSNDRCHCEVGRRHRPPRHFREEGVSISSLWDRRATLAPPDISERRAFRYCPSELGHRHAAPQALQRVGRSDIVPARSAPRHLREMVFRYCPSELGRRHSAPQRVGCSDIVPARSARDTQTLRRLSARGRHSDTQTLRERVFRSCPCEVGSRHSAP